jgi:hypothetical protein
MFEISMAIEKNLAPGDNWQLKGLNLSQIETFCKEICFS